VLACERRSAFVDVLPILSGACDSYSPNSAGTTNFLYRFLVV
jgi:hypothetical protein